MRNLPLLILSAGLLLAGPLTAPAAFRLESATGKHISLSDLRGQVVFLNFWATHCLPCRMEIPWLREFQSTLGAQKFTVVGIALDEEGWSVIRPFAAKNQINYPVLLGNDKLADQYQVDVMPTSLLIDRQGRIRRTFTGLTSKDELERAIREAISAR